jgi:hypothetical protein
MEYQKKILALKNRRVEYILKLVAKEKLFSNINCDTADEKQKIETITEDIMQINRDLYDIDTKIYYLQK